MEQVKESWGRVDIIQVEVAFPRRDRKTAVLLLSIKKSGGKCSSQGPIMGDLICNIKDYSNQMGSYLYQLSMLLIKSNRKPRYQRFKPFLLMFREVWRLVAPGLIQWTKVSSGVQLCPTFHLASLENLHFVFSLLAPWSQQISSCPHFGS